MKGGRNIAIIFKKSRVKLEDPSWERTLQADMENSVRALGYFNIIDLSARAKRLQEIQRSQTGLTDEEIQIGKEMKLDGFLYLNVDNKSRSSCKTSYTTKKVYPCGDRTKCKAEKVKITVKTLQFYLYIRGELINVATGQSMAFTNTNPVGVPVQGEGVKSCMSRQEAFPQAARVSAQRLARSLSPVVTFLRAEIDDDPKGSPEAVEEQVEKLLKEGKKWAKSGRDNIADAKKSWQRALKVSGYNSVYAYWNLGVAYWAEGNMREAEEHFNKAKELGGPDFLSKNKRRTLAKFKQEQQRLSLESS